MRKTIFGLVVGIILGSALTASATLPIARTDRENQKFVEDAAGNVTVRLLLTAP